MYMKVQGAALIHHRENWHMSRLGSGRWQYPPWAPPVISRQGPLPISWSLYLLGTYPWRTSLFRRFMCVSWWFFGSASLHSGGTDFHLHRNGTSSLLFLRAHRSRVIFPTGIWSRASLCQHLWVKELFLVILLEHHLCVSQVVLCLCPLPFRGRLPWLAPRPCLIPRNRGISHFTHDMIFYRVFSVDTFKY